jgi:circadian clock protein KaiB
LTAIVLRLFIAGHSAVSAQVVKRVTSECEQLLPGSCRLEVVDVLESPEKAERDRILATPTLLRLAPLPVVQLIGDMSDAGRLRTVLQGIPPARVM